VGGDHKDRNPYSGYRSSAMPIRKDSCSVLPLADSRGPQSFSLDFRRIGSIKILVEARLIGSSDKFSKLIRRELSVDADAYPFLRVPSPFSMRSSVHRDHLPLQHEPEGRRCKFCRAEGIGTVQMDCALCFK
jgi:hypothetical protein